MKNSIRIYHGLPSGSVKSVQVENIRLLKVKGRKQGFCWPEETSLTIHFDGTVGPSPNPWGSPVDSDTKHNCAKHKLKSLNIVWKKFIFLCETPAKSDLNRNVFFFTFLYAYLKNSETNGATCSSTSCLTLASASKIEHGTNTIKL